MESLFDFLYRDTNRINSYYAQLFQGKLSALERVDSTRDNQERTLSGKGNLSVVSGEATSKLINEVQESSKQVIDPHDLIVSDVIGKLFENGFVEENVNSAKNGSLILCSGVLTFVDKFFIELAGPYLDTLIGSAKSGQNKHKSQQETKNLQLIKNVLSKLTLPSMFILQTSEKINVCGVIKESGLEEPVTSYYFKHGENGLPNVYLIGVKEMAGPVADSPGALLSQGSRQVAQVLKNLIIPNEAMTVTPIALFRKINEKSLES
jgi:hypothetical protein